MLLTQSSTAYLPSCRRATAWPSSCRTITRRHARFRLLRAHGSSDGDVIDVAVSGGGPAGLAVAHAILRACPGKSVKVYEVADEYRPQGAGVQVDINGFRALKAIDPAIYNRLKEQCILIEHNMTLSVDGKQSRKSSFQHQDNLEQHGETQRMVAWNTIRQTLYEALPPGTVVFGQRVTGYEDDGAESGTVKVTLAGKSHPDGASTAAPPASSAQAKLLVGCDGIFSRVRKQTLNDGPPEFNGLVVWRARVDMSHADDFMTHNPGTSRFWLDGQNVGKDRISIVYPTGPSQYVWTTYCPTWRLEKAGFSFDPFSTASKRSLESSQSGTSAWERCIKCYEEDFASDFVDVVRATPPELVTEHGYYKRNVLDMPDDRWGAGLVTLAGDAAHVPPTDGQGLNLALEDAAVLGWHLKQKGLTPEALRAYEQERLPRVKAILSWPQMQPGRAKIVNEGTFHALAE